MFPGMRPQRGDFTGCTNVALVRPRVNWTEALGEVLGIIGKVLRRLSPHLGHFDGGDALWLWTFEFGAPHQGLIMRLAVALMRAQVLAGDEIDALVFASILAS
jgi:hypothetical protein